MTYLTAEDLLVMHARILDVIGGTHGVREPNLIAAIADKPKASFGGRDLYPSLHMKAAIYLEAVVNYHAFIDGNKRTGLASAARFLEINGYLFTATNKSAEAFVLGVATKKHGIDAVAQWLENNSSKT